MTSVIQSVISGTSTSNWKASTRTGWIVSLFIGQTLMYASRALLPICARAASREFLWTKSQTGSVLAAFFWGQAMTPVLGGHLADVVGGDLVLVCAATGWTLATLAYPFVHLSAGISDMTESPFSSASSQSAALAPLHRAHRSIAEASAASPIKSQHLNSHSVSSRLSTRIYSTFQSSPSSSASSIASFQSASSSQSDLLHRHGNSLSEKNVSMTTKTAAVVERSLSQTLQAPSDKFQAKANLLVFCVVILIRLAHGLFQGIHSPSVLSLLSKRVPQQKRGAAHAIQKSGMFLGILLAGSLGSALLTQYGWRTPFIVFGIFSLAWTLLTKHFLVGDVQLNDAHRASHQKQPHIHTLNSTARHAFCVLCPRPSLFIAVWRGARTISLKSLLSTSDSNPSNSSLTLGWKKILSYSSVWAMLLGRFTHNWAQLIILSWLPYYFHEQFPDAKAWIFNVIPWIVAIPTSLLSGFVSDKLIRRSFSVSFVRKLMESVNQMGSAGSLVLFVCVSHSYALSLLAMAACIAFSGFHCSGILLNASDLCPAASGALYGLMNTFGALPGLLGVATAGYLVQRYAATGWTCVFLMTAAINLLGCLIFACFGSGEPLHQMSSSASAATASTQHEAA